MEQGLVDEHGPPSLPFPARMFISGEVALIANGNDRSTSNLIATKDALTSKVQPRFESRWGCWVKPGRSIPRVTNRNSANLETGTNCRLNWPRGRQYANNISTLPMLSIKHKRSTRINRRHREGCKQFNRKHLFPTRFLDFNRLQ